MRFKHKGYVFQFTRGDHEGRHIHVFKDNRLVGIYDRVQGPSRGLEGRWNNDLREGIREFIVRLNERGYFN